MASAPAPLSDKEQDLFKKAERLFQKKLYKQALKNCEAILKKNEKHGETVALKGAILGRMAESDEQKQEAIDMCKRGVQLDLSSKNAWVHLARLYKATQRYEDAIKSFKMALRLAKQPADKNDYRRELTVLLAQTRNWQELADTRRQLQLDNREMIVHWIGYSVALFLAGNYTLALTVWREFSKNPPPSFSEKDIMEMKLFEARILEESGDLKGALSFLQGLKSSTNILSQEEISGRLELGLGMFDDAAKRYFALLKDRNPENYDYHRGLQSAICSDAKLFKRGGISLPVNPESSSEIVEKLIKHYEDLESVFPKSMACQRIPLDFCDEKQFEPRADRFIRNNLRKGVPCLFAVVKPLYRSRLNLVSRVVPSIVNKRLDELNAEGEGGRVEKGYALFFLAQHLDQLSPGCEAAIDTIQQAIDLDKSNADFLRFKARVLKHSGDFGSAFEVADSTRQLELNDRYLNNKAAKYALRADKPETALALTHLFTRGEDVHSLPDPATLHDIQCMWFENEAAASSARTGDIILALKNYHWVETHFNQIRDDEFDFHEYCIRRFVLSSYVNLVRMEERVRGAPAFRRMAKGAVGCWLRVFDKDEGIAALRQYEKSQKAAQKEAEKETDESQFAGMTPSERKRAMKKMKQEKQEKERLEMAKKLEENKKLLGAGQVVPAAKETTVEEDEDEAGADESNTPATEEKQADLGAMGVNRPHRRRTDLPPDPDPKGFKRFASLHKDPLKPAFQLLELAVGSNPQDADLWLLSFDVSIRKRETSAAWKSLERASALLGGWTTPSVFQRLVPFARFAALNAVPAAHPWIKGAKENKFALDDDTKKSLEQAVASLSKPPVELASANLSNADAEVVYASALALLQTEVEIPAALKALSQIVKPLGLCFQAQDLLKSKDAALAEEHKKRAHATWPRATAFV